MTESLITEEFRKKLESRWGRLFGVPVWRVDNGNTVHKARIKLTSSGHLILSQLIGHSLAHEDGAVPRTCFVNHAIEWFPR